MRNPMGDRAVDTRAVSAPIVLAMAGAALLVLFSTTAKIPVTYAGALVVAATPVAGPIAAVGGAVGILVHDLLRGAVGYWTATAAGWVFAFAGLVAWLGPAPGRTARPSVPVRRAVATYLGAVVIGGVLAAAVGGWLALAVGGERFYATAAARLPAVPVAAVVGAAVLVGAARRSDPPADVAKPDAPLQLTGIERWPWARLEPPPVGTALGLLLVGLGWLSGAMALDLLAHDLGLFRTEHELLGYAATLVGSGTWTASAASGLLLGIYRYGEGVVLLSGPLACLAGWSVYRWRAGSAPGATDARGVEAPPAAGPVPTAESGNDRCPPADRRRRDPRWRSMTRGTADTARAHDGPTEPSRRGLLLALAGLGLGAAAVGDGIFGGDSPRPAAGDLGDDHPASPAHVTTTAALAAALFPSSVSVDESFVERRVFGRVEPRPGHFEGVVGAVDAVDDHARARFGEGVADLSPARRRQVLAAMGVTAAHPTPDGTTAERVRYYLVNDLLFALFTSPESSHLTGIENPPGWPGGLDAYRRGPASR